MTDNSGFNISQLLNGDVIQRILQEQQKEAAGYIQAANVPPPAAPAIDVPVVEIPPPVKLRGTLRLTAVFNYADIVGKSYDQIRQLVYEAIANPNSGVEWLPEVAIYDMNLTQEVVRVDRPERQTEPGFLAKADSPGGVPAEGDSSLSGDRADPEHGIDVDDAIRSGTL